ncbi:helix-turn-helix domain-containing protein [Eubacteriaceae bacterium ES3]|nr:helix-turn-helix domain-containing protein [Eubacteriaceae bacterium ES3]
MGIGSNIKKILKKQNMTTTELAKSINMPVTTLYSLIKRDSDTEKRETIEAIADVLKVTVGMINDGYDKMPLGTTIRNYREEKNMSREELSKITGIQPEIIRLYEIGSLFPDIDTLDNLIPSIPFNDYQNLDESALITHFKQAREKMGMTNDEIHENTDFDIKLLEQFENGDLGGNIPLEMRYFLGMLIGYVAGDLGDENKEQFLKHLKSSSQKELLNFFNKLNDTGKRKAIESVELLTKIPEYQAIFIIDHQNDHE